MIQTILIQKISTKTLETIMMRSHTGVPWSEQQPKINLCFINFLFYSLFFPENDVSIGSLYLTIPKRRGGLFCLPKLRCSEKT